MRIIIIYIDFGVLNVRIKVNDLSFFYGHQQVLKDIDLSLNSGDILAIVGHNGSGKSTLVKCILRELKVDDNKIHIDNIDINDYKDWSNIGYVPQFVSSFNRDFPISVFEFLISSSIVKDDGKIDEILDKLGVLDLKHRNINDLSGGQQRRIFIARSMLNNAKLLVLDEPTVGVDSESEMTIYRILKELSSKGTTIIMITHHYDHVKNFVTHTLSLDKKVMYFGKSKNFDERLCEVC